MIRDANGRAKGSSPHTRGAPHNAPRTRGFSGIIPAYAGSTNAVDQPPLFLGDHPRIRGEHGSEDEWVPLGTGSSPHTRGAPLRARVTVLEYGIIPAYAGSTQLRRWAAARRWDHPRIRGEHHFGHVSPSSSTGSSPHTRGALSCRPLRPRRHGIIPAYAGSTPLRCDIMTAGWDHPRIRGEHEVHIRPLQGVEGSSPHTRGARSRERTHPTHPGIIPAYAGSTFHMSVCAVGTWDHPRIRGEHSGAAVPEQPGPGSSPHTRGAHEAAGFRR